MAQLTIYYKDANGKKTSTHYKHVYAITAGTAAQVLGEADARGNGIPLNAPLVQLHLSGTETATYDADKITIMLDD